MSATAQSKPHWLAAFSSGTLVGTLGGLIGLGGAEFRLPLLLMFGFAALSAVSNQQSAVSSQQSAVSSQQSAISNQQSS